MSEQFLVREKLVETVSVVEKPVETVLNKIVFVCMNLGEILGSKEALLEKMDYVCHLFARAAWNALEKGVEEIVIISPVEVDSDFINYFQEAFGVKITVEIGDLENIDFQKFTGQFNPEDLTKKFIDLNTYTQDLPIATLINLKLARVGLPSSHLELIKLNRKNYELVKRYLPKGLPKGSLVGLADIMNDKGFFMNWCVENEIPIVPGTQVLDIFDDSHLQNSVSEITARLKNENKLFIRTSKAGGGMGNLSVKLENGKYFISKESYFSKEEFEKKLLEIFRKWQKNQSLSVVVAKFFDNIPDGPSVYAEIYKTGNSENPDEVKIRILGTFAQELDPKSGDCVGMKYPNNLGFDQELVAIIQKYGELLARLGYIGKFNIDSADLNGKIAIIESNGRQTAANPICQIYDNGNNPSQNFDHVPVHISYKNLTEIIRDWRILGIPILGWENNGEFSKYGVAPLTGMNNMKREIGIIGTSNNQKDLNNWMKLAQFMVTNGLEATIDYIELFKLN